ncbi:uncharacterized protein CCOS01_13951 [Colletotrichum costaricense]|uniref:Uncharacterized protein n=1 Tax=Colletotrichum costaricense TaxID=1209916 RepID=A0AAI9YJZ0_9PEZI|nr:uncharacterized protein CCOS01_13951 [Colletotrichum costaricense]KAK1514011.1 hypothetical protein CCOS01_13951 [Colletotrichum costaricense]
MYFSDSLQHESLQHFKRRSPRDFENLIRYSVDRSDNRHRRRQGRPSRGDAAAVRSGGCRISPRNNRGREATEGCQVVYILLWGQDKAVIFDARSNSRAHLA